MAEIRWEITLLESKAVIIDATGTGYRSPDSKVTVLDGDDMHSMANEIDGFLEEENGSSGEEGVAAVAEKLTKAQEDRIKILRTKIHEVGNLLSVIIGNISFDFPGMFDKETGEIMAETATANAVKNDAVKLNSPEVISFFEKNIRNLELMSAILYSRFSAETTPPLDSESKSKREGYQDIVKSFQDLKGIFNGSDVEESNLAEIVERIVNGLRAQFKDTTINYERPAGDTMVTAKVSELVEVIDNITRNAVHAVQGNEIGNRLVVVRTSQTEKETSIEIKDNGVGMTPETLAQIGKVGFTTKKGDGNGGGIVGTGFGVAASREIIAHYGGEMIVDSQLGKGSIFKITLPNDSKDLIQGLTSDDKETVDRILDEVIKIKDPKRIMLLMEEAIKLKSKKVFGLDKRGKVEYSTVGQWETIQLNIEQLGLQEQGIVFEPISARIQFMKVHLFLDERLIDSGIASMMLVWMIANPQISENLKDTDLIFTHMTDLHLQPKEINMLGRLAEVLGKNDSTFKGTKFYRSQFIGLPSAESAAMSSEPRILVVDDDPFMGEYLDSNNNVERVRSLEEARSKIAEGERFHLVVLNHNVDQDGQLAQENPQMKFIVYSRKNENLDQENILNKSSGNILQVLAKGEVKQGKGIGDQMSRAVKSYFSSPKKVFIINDDLDNEAEIRKSLEGFNYELTFSKRTSAYKRLDQAKKGAYDLVVTWNTKMPRYSGLTIVLHKEANIKKIAYEITRALPATKSAAMSSLTKIGILVLVASIIAVVNAIMKRTEYKSLEPKFLREIVPFNKQATVIKNKIQLTYFVDKPLLKAAERLWDLNIETIQSTANRKDARSGKVWLQFDYTNLSDHNKAIVKSNPQAFTVSEEDGVVTMNIEKIGDRAINGSTSIASIEEASLDLLKDFQIQQLKWRKASITTEELKAWLREIGDDPNRYTNYFEPARNYFKRDFKDGFKGDEAAYYKKTDTWYASTEILVKAKEAEAALKLSTTESAAMAKNGGIDFNTNKMDLQVQNAGEGIKFDLNPAMLAQLQNAPGFMPVIIDIQPMTDLPGFMGMKVAH